MRNYFMRRFRHAAVLGMLCLSLAVISLLSSAATDEVSSPSDNGEHASDFHYMKGRQLFLDGEYGQAATHLEQALKADPENPLLNQQLSEIYLRLSNLDRAEVLAKKALEKDPKNLEYLANLAGIYASLKRYDEAKKFYETVLKLDPKNQKVLLYLGIVENESGNPADAIKILTRAIEANPENYMAYYYRGRFQLERDNEDAAKADLNECLNIRPSFIEAGQALGLMYEKTNEIDKAIDVYNRISGNGRFKKRLAQLYLQKNEFDKALQELLEYEKVEVDDYTARVKIALIYFELKKFDEARKRFEIILKEQPGADVRFYLGAVYEEQKNLPKAIKEYRKVTKESSFFKEAMLHVALILREQDRMKEGLKFAAQLVSENPEVVEFYDLWASFYEQDKQYKKALEILAKALKKFPDDEKLLYFEGALLDKMGDRQGAIASMKKLLIKNDKNAHALNFLGYTYAEMGENLDEAENLIQRALAARPNDGYIEDSLGWVYFKQKKLDKAVAQLEKAAALLPEEPVVLEHLGDIYLELKKYEKASDMYEKAMKFSRDKKDNDTVKKIKEKLAALQDKKRSPSAKPEK